MQRRGIDIDLAEIPLDDTKTFEMLARGETVGVFQVESAGMRRALRRHAARPLRGPDRAGRALPARARWRTSRPIARASSAASTVEYIHPKLEPILQRDLRRHHLSGAGACRSRTILAGYTLGEADLLRRAMGKKIRAEMDAQRERFVSGAIERGIARRPGRRRSSTACAKFAEYGFNKVALGALRADHLPDGLS